MRKDYLLTLLSAVLMFHVFGQNQEIVCHIHNPKGVPRDRVTDFKTALISIDINPYKKHVKGSVNFQFEVIQPVVDSFWIDAPNIEIDYVLLDDDSIAYRTSSKGLHVILDTSLIWEIEHSLTIGYQTKPKKGMYFVGWDSCFSSSTPNQVWTQGQGIDNRHWFPHFDDLSDKLITETVIRFQNGYNVLSNGDLIEKNIGDSATTWHYKMQKPHSSYLTMIAIGNYQVDTVFSQSGTRIRNWYYANQPERVGPTYFQTSQLLDYLEEYTGVLYPWTDYAQVPVHNFLYGAMENTSATIFSDDFFVDSTQFLGRNYVYVNAHEMAHHWFGNLITARSPEAHWIHEGFATFFHGSWQGEVFGKEAGNLMFNSFKNQALLAGELNQLPVTHAEAGSSRHYMKSAFVLRMLRNEVGEEVFKKTITHFLNKYAYQNITSEDFLMAFQDVAGVSLNWFFEDWVYTGGEPKMNFTLLNSWEGNKGTFLKIEQLNAEDIEFKRFHLPIVVETKSNEEEIDVFIHNDTVIRLSDVKPNQIEKVIIDPSRHLLMQISYSDWPVTWMKNVLKDSTTNILVKEEAINWLASKSELSSKAAIASAFVQESDYLGAAYLEISDEVKLTKEILNFLRLEGYPLTKQVLISKISTDSKLFEEAMLMLSNDAYNDVVLSSILKYGSEGWVNNQFISLLDRRTKNYPSLRINYAQLLFLNGKQNLALSELDKLTAPNNSIEVRLTAFSILAHLNYFSLDLARNYCEALSSFNRKLRIKTQEILKEYNEEELFEIKELFDSQECMGCFVGF